ncbi:TerD family protein [Geopseudomonas aromaticivorans]
MGISLQKKQTLSLEKEAGSTLRKVRLGLGWDPVKPSGFFGKLLSSDAAIDLDASCIVLDAGKQPLDLVWFRQLKSNCGKIVHSGDNRTGEGAGDDETIAVDLAGLNGNVQHLVFTVNSFLGQSFEKVANAYCRIVDAESNTELARFNLAEQGNHTGVIMAYLSRTGSGWNFTAVGTPSNGRDVTSIGQQAAAAVNA